MHRTQIFLPTQLHQILKTEARRERVTMSELIREVLESYVRHSHRKQTEKGIKTLLELTEVSNNKENYE